MSSDHADGATEHAHARLADFSTAPEALAHQFGFRRKNYSDEQAEQDILDEQTLIDYNCSSDLASIEEYTRSDNELQQEIETDPVLALENSPQRPPWYADEARRAIAAIRVENVVVVAYVNSPLQPSAIVSQLAHRCISQNPASYAAIIMRHLNPRPESDTRPPRRRERTALHTYTGDQPVSATSLIFPTGKITTTGARDFATCVHANRRAVDAVAPLHPGLRLERLALKNVVAKTEIFPIDITAFAENNASFVHKIDGYWVGAFMHLNQWGHADFRDRTVTILLFEKAEYSSIVFTSMRCRADVERTFRIIYPLFVPYAKGRCAATAVVTSQALVVAANSLQRTNKRANQSDAGVARNMLAISSMVDENADRARRHEEMLASVRQRKKPRLVATQRLDDAEANALVDEQDRFQ